MDIAASGAKYEAKLDNALGKAGIKTGGLAGFTAAADVTVFTAPPDDKPYGIEAKASVSADMGSASLGYDPASGKITISQKVMSKPIGQEVAERLNDINASKELMSKIQAVEDAGFLGKSKYTDLKAWQSESGLASAPTETFRIGQSDLIARHYQAKGETAEYIQIKGFGLYIMDLKVDPLGLKEIGALELLAPLTITVGVRQRGSRTRDESNLGLRAQVRVMKKGMSRSGLDLDSPGDIVKLKKVLGY